MHKWLDNLGSSYNSRFKKTRHLDDISEAILSWEKAIQLTLNGHPDIPVTHYNHACAYDELFQRLGNQSDPDKAVSNYSMAITRSSGIHSFKLLANKRLAKIFGELYPLQSINSYSTAIRLASHLAGLQFHFYIIQFLLFYQYFTWFWGQKLDVTLASVKPGRFLSSETNYISMEISA